MLPPSKSALRVPRPALGPPSPSNRRIEADLCGRMRTFGLFWSGLDQAVAFRAGSFIVKKIKIVIPVYPGLSRFIPVECHFVSDSAGRSSIGEFAPVGVGADAFSWGDGWNYCRERTQRTHRREFVRSAFFAFFAFLCGHSILCRAGGEVIQCDLS